MVTLTRHSVGAFQAGIGSTASGATQVRPRPDPRSRRVVLTLTLALLFPLTAHSQTPPPQHQDREVASMSKIAKGTFEVSLEPLSFEGANEDWKLGRMSIDKQISGDLVATTKGQMLMARGDIPGSAGYVAIEHVTGTLDGRTGTFVLQHAGTMDRVEPSLSVTVVPDSGTEELKGLAGDFEIEVADGKHSYVFTYVLREDDSGPDG
jgi:hypothetical protein